MFTSDHLQTVFEEGSQGTYSVIATVFYKSIVKVWVFVIQSVSTETQILLSCAMHSQLRLQ